MKRFFLLMTLLLLSVWLLKHKAILRFIGCGALARFLLLPLAATPAWAQYNVKTNALSSPQSSSRHLGLRLLFGFGSSDLGGLNRVGLGFNDNSYAARVGGEGEKWLSTRFAVGGRVVYAEDQADDSKIGCWNHRRRSILIEPNILISAVSWRALKLVAGAGIGIAHIEEGDHEGGLFCGDARGPQKKRVSFSASAPGGVLLHLNRFSLAALLRFETIGGKTTIGGTFVGLDPDGKPVTTEKITSHGLSINFNLGLGVSF